MFDFSDLINILDDLTPSDVINEDDYLHILELTGELIHEYVTSDYLKISEPSFHNELYNDISEEVMNQIKDAYSDDIEVELATIIEEAIKIYFTYVIPRRSYMNSEVYGHLDIDKMSKKLEYLTNVPQPDQRTDEWYRFRHKHLTASSIWKAFSTSSNKNQLIYGKCAPLDVSKYSRVNLESPLHWGQKYEDVSIQWYEKHYKTKVRDFGCIPHKELHYLAASPDGINVESSSLKYGRMLEVKNIVNREITGIPKYEYWIQMQIQMEVCELSECDFLETRFTEYEDYEQFKADGTYTHTADGKPKGIMMLYIDHEGSPIYKYLDIGSDEEDAKNWNLKMMEEMDGAGQWLKNIYWKMDEVSVVLVKRNKKWFQAAKPILDDLWKTIEHEREYGYEHRAPRKRSRTSKEQNPITGGICLIKLDEVEADVEMAIVSPKNDSKVENVVIMQIDTQTLNDADQSFDI